MRAPSVQAGPDGEDGATYSPTNQESKSRVTRWILPVNLGQIESCLNGRIAPGSDGSLNTQYSTARHLTCTNRRPATVSVKGVKCLNKNGQAAKARAGADLYFCSCTHQWDELSNS
jgi:hypothetical protein